MLHWLTAIFALWSTTTFAYKPPTQVVVYGDDAYPPYSYVQQGEVKGIYTEILKTIFSQMEGYEVTIKPIPWKRGLKLLKLGKGFALYPPYYYSDKRPYISPYSEPILDEQVVVYCRPESVTGRNLKQWPNDYFGLTIGINEAFALGGEQFWNAVSKKQLSILVSKGNRASLLNLYNKRSDCYINDRLSIIWDINAMSAEGLVDNQWQLTLGTIVSSEKGYLGFTQEKPESFPYKEDFVNKFNQQLKQLQQDGTIDKLLEEYFTTNQ